MGKINYLKMRLYQVIVIKLIVVACCSQTIGQDIYLNSYVLDSEYPAKNVIFKIDLETKAKIDSAILPVSGEFISKYPFNFTRNIHSVLLDVMQNGVPGKNAGPPKGHTDTYYAVVLPSNLNIIRIDSLLFRAIIGFNKMEINRFGLQWIDDANSNLPAQEDILGLDNRNTLRTLLTRAYVQPNYSLNDINQFKNPRKLLTLADTTVYWDVESSSPRVFIFKHNSSVGVFMQTLVGDRTEMNIVVGYSELENKIYCFITPFKMYYYSPPVYSADTTEMAICTYDPSTLNRIDSVSFPVGNAYAAMEVGTADSIGPYLYYYYFWQDGYVRFDPAYLLIFDTRTNEASWLRVGWR